MSLVIRRVKEISKKRNRKPRHWYGPFDDNPSKLLVDEEYGEEQDSLPSLNSVYRKTIVGTPILFRRLSGWECQDAHSYNVNFQSITFMKEYHNKSFEELRWEDYLSNRKGNLYIHQETNFPRIVTNYNFSISDNFEFFHPLPRNILKHLDLGRTLGLHPKDIANKNNAQHLFIGKSVEKNQKMFTNNSETNFWHLKQARMSNEKIKSFFVKSDFSFDSRRSLSNILFFLPCRNLEPNLLKPRSKKKLVAKSFSDFAVEKKIEIRKYNDDYEFNKTFLQNRLHPYLRNRYRNIILKNSQRITVSNSKYHILGRKVTSFNNSCQ